MASINSLGMIAVDMLMSLHKFIFEGRDGDMSPDGRVSMLYYPDRVVGIFLDTTILNAEGEEAWPEFYSNPEVSMAFIRDIDGVPVTKVDGRDIKYAYLVKSEGLRRRCEMPFVDVLSTIAQRIVHKRYDIQWVRRRLQEPIFGVACHEVRHELQVSGKIPNLRTEACLRDKPETLSRARDILEKIKKRGLSDTEFAFEIDAFMTELLIQDAWLAESRAKYQHAAVEILVS